VKYSRFTLSGIQHPDLYQLLAYTVAAGLPTGLLIYAAGEGDPSRHVISSRDVRCSRLEGIRTRRPILTIAPTLLIPLAACAARDSPVKSGPLCQQTGSTRAELSLLADLEAVFDPVVAEGMACALFGLVMITS
jgi:hypothetical protein